MCTLNTLCILFLFPLAATISYANANEINRNRNRRDISEECRFMGPLQGHGRLTNGEQIPPPMPPPFCCELPSILLFSPEDMAKCHDMMPNDNRANHRNNHGRRGQPSFSGTGNRIKKANDNKDESREDIGVPSPFSQERKECITNCLFNISGLLTPDNMLNEEVLNQKLLEEVSNNTKWASNVNTVFKKCIAAAKEANSQSQKSCKPGAAEYMKCMLRELFFNCPNDLWINSPDCNEFKNKLEKCPNLHPPPHPLPPMPHRPRRVSRGNKN